MMDHLERFANAILILGAAAFLALIAYMVGEAMVSEAVRKAGWEPTTEQH